jgi:hypothetical protein
MMASGVPDHVPDLGNHFPGFELLAEKPAVGGNFDVGERSN